MALLLFMGHLEMWFIHEIIQQYLLYIILQLPHLRNMKLVKEDFKGKSTPTIQKVPSYMWLNQISYSPPNNPEYRRKIAKSLFGWTHQDWCSNDKFHSPYLPGCQDSKRYDLLHNRGGLNKVYCVCRHCGEGMEWLHERFCRGFKVPRES